MKDASLVRYYDIRKKASIDLGAGNGRITVSLLISVSKSEGWDGSRHLENGLSINETFGNLV